MKNNVNFSFNNYKTEIIDDYYNGAKNAVEPTKYGTLSFDQRLDFGLLFRI